MNKYLEKIASKVHHFATEEEALAALHSGKINDNTPIKIGV